MKKEIGASAGVLALLAVLVHTQLPGGREAGGEASSKSGSADKVRTPRRVETVDERREGPWTATRAFFNAGELPNDRQAPDAPPSPCERDPKGALACLSDPTRLPHREHLLGWLGIDGAQLSDRYETWSIVATVADPAHTRLALFLDRQLEAMVRSLQAGGFELAGQWAPWSGATERSDGGADEKRRERRLQREQEELPGVLIFRRFKPPPRVPPLEFKRETLFVFLVPETPTTGVSGPPFIAALHLAHALSQQENVGFLAPSFSGSFDSLSDIVKLWNTHAGAATPITGRFFSGTVSSSQRGQTFHDRTNLDFSSGIVSSRDNDAAFCALLANYGLQTREVAYLTEDETAFSDHDDAIRSPSCVDSIPQYVFPREISHLRNVYRSESGPPAGGDKTATAPGVSFSIKDPNSGEDAVPTFSAAQTPVSQNAAVHAIIEELRRRRTRLVYLVATNVLDALFLAQVIREESPDTRVLTEDPDVVFIAAAAQTPLLGTLFLSTYPMFFEGDEWLQRPASRASRRLLFAGPDFIGIHNATQAVLARVQAVTPGAAARNVRGYAQVHTTSAHPAVWLLTLNRSGFQPLDQMDKSSPAAEEAHRDWFAFPANASPGAEPEEPRFPTPPRSWFITVVCTTAFLYWGCGLVLYRNLSPAYRWPVWLSLENSPDLTAPRLLAMSAALLSLSALEWILLLPVWVSHFEAGALWDWFAAPPAWQWFAAPAGFIGWAAPPAIACWLWRKRHPGGLGVEARVYLGLEILLYAFVTGTWLACCFPGATPARLLFRFRALELYSGSSPALPLLLVGGVTLMGALFYLKRFSRAGFACPRLDFSGFRSLQAPLVESYNAINCQITIGAIAGSAEWIRRVRSVAAPICVTLLLLRPTLYASAFERPRYNYALSACIAVLLFCIAMACYDLIHIWKHLKKLLGLIDLLLLRGAFQRIAHEWPKRPIWASSERLSKPFLARQMLVSLHNRGIVLGDDESKQDVSDLWALIPLRFSGGAAPVPVLPPAHAVSRSGAAAQCALQKETATTMREFLDSRNHYEALCANLLAKIAARNLIPLWEQKVNDEAAKPDGPLQTYCSDFVALQFTRYLIYVVGEVQAISWCLSFSLLTLILVLNSYSPQAPLLLSRFLAALFVATGVVVFWVFSGMERDAILSRIAGTEPGELNQEFWIQLAGMGILPFLGVLSHLFPSIAVFFSSWIAPGMDVLH